VTPLARILVLILTVVTVVLLPLFATLLIFLNVARGGAVTDFEQAFYTAAEALVDGESPYPAGLDDPAVEAGAAYVYPPLTAIATIPLTVLSVETAAYVVMGLLVAMVLLTLYVLEIRDWRCYGVALIWPPVISAVQTGNITIPLAFGAALAWRFRDRAWAGGAALGVSLAAKLIFWPLLLWQAVSGRLRSAVLAVFVGAVVVFGTWAAIGFDGLRDYPDLLRRIQELEEPQGYTVYALALDLGASSAIARALGVAVAVGLLAAVVVAGRRGDDRRAFAFAVAAALACSPIVWFHYFALLLVAVAVAEPRLGAAWFVPLLMFASGEGTYNGTTLQTAVTIAIAVLTVAVAVRPDRARFPLERLTPPRPVPLERAS
jgi:Glycosyltransferase family 87